MLRWKSFAYFPIFIVMLLGGGFWVCFGIAVSNKHIDPLTKWPSISETGQRPPESYIFTLLLTVGTFLIFVTVYFEFKYVKHFKKEQKCNVAAMIVGALVCFGGAVVAAFQRPTVVHYIGAGLAFLGLLIYSIMVVFISWKLANTEDPGNSNYLKKVVYMRIVIVTMELLSLFLMVVSYILHLSIHQNDGTFLSVAHVGEWLLIYFAIIFLGTVSYDMHKIRRANIKLTVKDEEEAHVLGCNQDHNQQNDPPSNTSNI